MTATGRGTFIKGAPENFGESLMGKQAYGIDPEMVAAVAQQVKTSSISASRCAS